MIKPLLRYQSYDYILIKFIYTIIYLMDIIYYFMIIIYLDLFLTRCSYAILNEKFQIKFQNLFFPLLHFS